MIQRVIEQFVRESHIDGNNVRSGSNFADHLRYPINRIQIFQFVCPQTDFDTPVAVLKSPRREPGHGFVYYCLSING